MNSLYLFPPDDNPLKKKCTGPCGRTLDATKEYFYETKYGFRSNCKDCCKAYDKARKSKPEVKERNKNNWKAYYSQPEVHEHILDKAKNHRNRPEIREYRKAYRRRPEVRERVKAQRKDYQRAYQRAYHHRPGVHERKLAYMRGYQSRPEIQKHIKDYRMLPETQERHRSHEHARRTRNRSVKGTHTPQQIKEQLKRQKHKCYYAACGHSKFKKVKGRYVYHIEHTFPLSRVAGTDIPANNISYLVLACPACNYAKRDRFPWEWTDGGRLL